MTCSGAAGRWNSLSYRGEILTDVVSKRRQQQGRGLDEHRCLSPAVESAIHQRLNAIGHPERQRRIAACLHQAIFDQPRRQPDIPLAGAAPAGSSKQARQRYLRRRHTPRPCSHAPPVHVFLPPKVGG
jgi:hypothetical protein